MPEKPSDKTFKELELVQHHENPKPSAIVQQFRFNTRFRKSGEFIASYVAELRNLSEHCDFQNTFEEMLRDRLVCGINDEQIQRRLLNRVSLLLHTLLNCETFQSIVIFKTPLKRCCVIDWSVELTMNKFSADC